jgi:excisionase family DNA binding protein
VSNTRKALSVTQAAAFCGVRRNTVGYWVRSRKLYAERVGRTYSIPVEGFLSFLKSTGQKIPAELADEDLRTPCFPSLQSCWQYWQNTAREETCKECIIHRNQLSVCFIVRECLSACAEQQCIDCPYYIDTYLRRIRFIHQLDLAAAVYKDLFFWGGNKKFAELCGVQEKDLVGMGIERIVHPDSMEDVIGYAKRRAFGDPKTPKVYSVFLKSRQNDGLEVHVGVCPLCEPSGSYLVIGQAKTDRLSVSPRQAENLDGAKGILSGWQGSEG